MYNNDNNKRIDIDFILKKRNERKFNIIKIKIIK